MSETIPASLDSDLRALLADVLGLAPARTAAFTAQTPLFGALPELDSMAVAGLFTALEDRFGFVLEEDEIDGDLLETYGALLVFVARKRGHG